MSTHDTAWPAGTPNWVDCSFEHLHKARKFYAELFGWQIDEGRAELGHYSVALKHGHAAAGLVPRMSPEIVPQWSTFMATDDVEATTAAVREAGGNVVVEPMDVPGSGRMAFFQDPEGAAFGAWQAGEHRGFGIVNEPGSVCWNDLMTRDLEAAKTFYAKVFGYTYEETSSDYVLCRRPGDNATVAGMHLATEMPTDVPANWLTHFAVADRDSSMSIVEEIDGKILMSFDTPMGPEAVVEGLEGETFAIIGLRDDAA